MARLLESKHQLFLHLGREQPIRVCEISGEGVGIAEYICLPYELSFYKL